MPLSNWSLQITNQGCAAGLRKLDLSRCGEMTAGWLAPSFRKLVKLTYLAVGKHLGEEFRVPICF